MGEPAAERLSPADASNVVLDAQDQVNTFLLAGLFGPGGFVGADGAVDLGRVRTVLAGRLRDPELRRFGERVSRQGRHLAWEACPPDLAWHVREVAPVAGREGLAERCASLMTAPLPADRPLWEMLLVPGAGPAGPGLVFRVHHAVADGMDGVRLARRLFDPAGGPEPLPRPPARPAPPGPRRSPVRSLARLAAMLRRPVGPTVLLGPISSRRAVAFADVDLAALARGGRAAGGTVNDALLAAVAGAAAVALRACGERLPAALPASVPVALPDRGASGNAVGVMVVPLPVGEPDAAARVARIARVTAEAKQQARAQGTLELTRTRWGSRLFGALARRQRFIALFVTSVRGPEQPLRLAGAPLVAAWPLAPIQGNVRLGVAAFSYAGRLGCAVHLGTDALDPAVFGGSLGDELARIADPG